MNESKCSLCGETVLVKKNEHAEDEILDTKRRQVEFQEGPVVVFSIGYVLHCSVCKEMKKRLYGGVA